MEGLARMVAESMARHGFEPGVDHQRLQWSRWFRLESSFDLVLLPSKAGLFALGEEIVAPGELPVGGGKRMLAVLEVNQALDLGLALGRLFSPTGSLKERIASGRVFARYSVIEDDAQRESACAALQRWLAQSTETATGVSNELSFQPANDATSLAAGFPAPEPRAEALHPEVKRPEPIPAGF